MYGSRWKVGLGALAASLALATSAQTQPAQPAPATTAPAATAAEQSNAKAALDAVHDWCVRSVDAAKVIATKATSPKLKELANRTVQDNGRIEQEAQQIARERGIALAPASQLLANPQHQSGMNQVKAASGAEGERIMASALVDERSAAVNSLKRLRDQTPGKDARLKKWLDDVENTAEAQSTAAFAARSEVNQQRQGRTPPK